MTEYRPEHGDTRGAAQHAQEIDDAGALRDQRAVERPQLSSVEQPLPVVARDLPWIVQLFAIMLLTDFAQYWFHRAFHRWPFLWGFHAVHHSARSMDWITALASRGRDGRI